MLLLLLLVLLQLPVIHVPVDNGWQNITRQQSAAATPLPMTHKPVDIGWQNTTRQQSATTTLLLQVPVTHVPVNSG